MRPDRAQPHCRGREEAELWFWPGPKESSLREHPSVLWPSPAASTPTAGERRAWLLNLQMNWCHPCLAQGALWCHWSEGPWQRLFQRFTGQTANKRQRKCPTDSSKWENRKTEEHLPASAQQMLSFTLPAGGEEEERTKCRRLLKEVGKGWMS